MLNTLRNTFSTVTSFVGGQSASAASDAPSTNDAVEPSRTRPSRSPTFSGPAPPSPVDLTSPPRQTLSATGEHFRNQRRPTNNTHISANEARPVGGGQRRATGTNPMLNPLRFLEDMGKPGASQAFTPTNTLDSAAPRALSSAIRTYGNRSRSNYIPIDTDVQFIPQRPYAGSPPAKRRRTDNESPQQSHDSIDILDEIGDIQETRPSSRTSDYDAERPPSRRSARSAGSVHTSQPSSKGNTPSEFSRTADMSNPHRKKSRTPSNNASTPIPVDDDPPKLGKKHPRRILLEQFEQGIGASRHTSRHDVRATGSRSFEPKMNHSTNPYGGLGRRILRNPDNLREKFKRGYIADDINDNESSLPVSQLRRARAHCFEQHENCTLAYREDLKEYHIKATDSESIIHTISFRNVNQAWSDEESRIRLMGPMNSRGLKYTVDLMFFMEQDLKDFTLRLKRSITQKSVHVKSSQDMKTIFSKPLDIASRSPESAVASSVQTGQVKNGSQRPGALEGLLRPRKSLGPSKNSAQSVAIRAPERPVRKTRATQTVVLDSEEEHEMEKFSEIHGLGPRWNMQLNYNSGRRRAVVDFEDLPRLDNGEFLNDQLVDFYLLYLFDQMKVPREKVYMFNTHFFSTLTRKVPGHKSQINYEGVKRWTAKEDIFGYDYIVVPINQETHWYLAIICNAPNISRAPAGLDSDITKDPISDLSMGREGKATALSEHTPPSAMTDLMNKKMPNPEVELTDEDEARLNLVDAHAHMPGSSSTVEVGSSSTVQSPSAETQQMKQLSLNDRRSGGNLLGDSSSWSPKKLKRKPGPPPRKWNPAEPVIIVLDSLGGSAKSGAVRVLKEYIREEGQEKRGMEAKITQNAFYAKESQIPMQPNFSDCGVYLLGYMQKFFENPDKFKNRLLSGEMRPETDWLDMAMPMMRDQMRDILFDLYAQQKGKHEQQRAERRQAKHMKSSSTANGTKGTDDKSTARNEPSEVKDDVSSKAANNGPALADFRADKELESRAETTAESRPRLASPFERQPTPKHEEKSSSLCNKTPVKVDGSPAHEANQQITPAMPGRSKSPIVLVQNEPQVQRQSPKRSFADTHDADDADTVSASIEVGIPKRLRMASDEISRAERSEKLREHCEPDVKRIRSSDLRQLRGASMPARGSSHDPIEIDDSQETPSTRPPSAKRKSRHLSDGPDMIEKPPPSAKRSSKRGSTPVMKLNDRGSPSIRRETSSTNHSPFPGDKLVKFLQRESSTPEKGLVVEETPPPTSPGPLWERM